MNYYDIETETFYLSETELDVLSSGIVKVWNECVYTTDYHDVIATRKEFDRLVAMKYVKLMKNCITEYMTTEKGWDAYFESIDENGKSN